MVTKPAEMTEQEWAERREEFSFHPDIITAVPLPRRVDGSPYRDVDEPSAAPS